MADQEVPLTPIEAVTKAAAAVEPAKFQSCFEDTDTELLRSRIAKLVLDTAHELGLLKSVHRVSTMRELMYNLIAQDTKKAKEFHSTHKSRPSETMREIKAAPMALAVFNAMYPRKLQEKQK
jgi:hypothetical protein